MPELIRIDWRCVLSYSSFAVMRKLPFTATTVCIESWLLNCIGSCGAKSLAILRAILHTSVPLGLQTDRSFSMVSAEAHNMAATVRLLLTSSESKAYFFSKDAAASFVIESAIFLFSETALSILDLRLSAVPFPAMASFKLSTMKVTASFCSLFFVAKRDASSWPHIKILTLHNLSFALFAFNRTSLTFSPKRIWYLTSAIFWSSCDRVSNHSPGFVKIFSPALWALPCSKSNSNTSNAHKSLEHSWILCL